MNKCPKCGHEWLNKNQAKGGKSRWKGMTKKQRSEEMKLAGFAYWWTSEHDLTNRELWFAAAFAVAGLVVPLVILNCQHRRSLLRP
jgi:hypothetical protein